MELNKFDMTLEEAIEVIKEILPEHEATTSLIAERKVLNAVHNGELVMRNRGRWRDDGGFKYKHWGDNSEAKRIFGTEWRKMLRLKCSECKMLTLVDDTIAYKYCPHCGAQMNSADEP